MAKILITEDELIIALDLKQMLSSQGHEVIGIATDAEEAIEKTYKYTPDLIFMDININGKIDGVELAKIIRADFDIPIIFCSAYCNKKKINTALNLDSTSYIIKPFTKNTIESVLKKVL